MENKWNYNQYQIEDGLKPGSNHFQYFFIVSEKDDKKCNYCIWIEDEALSRFDQTKDVDAIVSTQRDIWVEWVKKKIDDGIFQSKVLKFEKMGEKEIDLTEMTQHLSMD